VEASSKLDLGIWGRTVLAGTYIVVQAALVATAYERPDHVFGFQMFNESSTISIELSRRIRRPDGTVLVARTAGEWQARDAHGVVHAFSWSDRVKDPIVGTLGRPVHAAYGVDAQLFHLQKALDDVASHIEEDAETVALIADVSVNRNGHDLFDKHLESQR
jgi:hypothetical protein